jgi:alkanesulfonate monooxygenase
MSIRFHWSMSSAGEKLKGANARGAVSGLPKMDVLARFCRHAEECGIESLLTAFGFHRPDPLVLAGALGALTSKIKFMCAARSGIASPTLFVQQVNTVAAVTGGRICLNIVAGHTPEEQRYYGDFLLHDERYHRTDEFLAVCEAFWKNEGEVDFDGKYYRIEKGKLNIPFMAPDRRAPEIFLGGNSELAERLAARYADCLWRLPDRPEVLRPRVAPLVAGGTEVGLLISLIVRPTHAQAVEAANAMLAELGGQPRRTHEEFAKKSDSVAFRSTYQLAEQGDSDWLTPTLWAGAVPYMGAPAMALVGDPEEVAEALLAYKAVGITQFLFMGWPDFDEMTIFSRDVLPLVRARERASHEAASTVAATA